MSHVIIDCSNTEQYPPIVTSFRVLQLPLKISPVALYFLCFWNLWENDMCMLLMYMLLGFRIESVDLTDSGNSISECYPFLMVRIKTSLVPDWVWYECLNSFVFWSNKENWVKTKKETEFSVFSTYSLKAIEGRKLVENKKIVLHKIQTTVGCRNCDDVIYQI